MDFTFENELARENARLVHELSRDLTLIAQLQGPGIRDIVAAPMLENWWIGSRLETALVGTVSGHPFIADGAIVTSPLHYLDATACFARTFNRWYRLGQRATELA